jgi:alanine racemase
VSRPSTGQAIPGRSTRAIINLDAIAGNLRAFRAGITPTTRIMAVVKANGYGHGATMIARTALDNGADELGVATVEEGLRLRTAGITAPVLVLGPIHTSEIATALSADLMLSVADPDFIEVLAAETERQSKGQARVHLKIDTGMHRYGAAIAEATSTACRIAAHPTLQLVGVFSHFASADETKEAPTRQQLAAFEAVLRDIQAAGIDPVCRHIANSAATLRDRAFDFDMVRIGIALYGIAPSNEIGLWPGMKQAMTIQSRIHRLIQLEPGDRVSYGGTYQASHAETAALIPIGYADGYQRSLSNRSWMDIASTRAPVRGRVCMDQTVVGLAEGAGAALGQDVVVVGDGTSAAPTLAELATLAGTIPYELATSLSARVPRHYLQNGQIIAVEDLSGLRTVQLEQ